MSLHVSTICRWMHHDCRSQVRAQLISSSHHFTPAPVPPAHPHCQFRRPVIGSPAAALTSVSHNRFISVATSRKNVASPLLTGSSEEPDALTPPTQASLPNPATSRKPQSEAKRRPLKNHEKFPVRLITFPVSDDFVDHPGRYAEFPGQFSKKLLKVFNFYARRCHQQQHDLKTLRLHFAQECHRADGIWATRHQSGLQNWLNHHLDNEWRVSSLCDLLIGSLIISPHRILSVLSTLKPIPNDWEVRAHCLYLAGWLHKPDFSADPDLMLQLDSHINSLRDFQSWPPSSVSLDHLRLLFWRSDESQIRSIIAHLQTSPLKLDTETLLWLTMFCAKKHNMPDEAFSFLSRVSQEDMQNPSKILLQCAQVQLQHDTVDKTPHGPNFRYLPHLLQKGLVPDSLLYQAIIQRALDSDCPWVAWDVYHHLQSTNVPTTYHTHLAMLKNAFEDGYIERVDEIMSKIERDEELYRNKVVISYAMNIVRRLVYNSKAAAPSQGVAQILALYNRAYHKKPLAPFGLVEEEDPTSIDSALVEPSILAITYTVWACVLCHRHGKSVHHFWNRICKAVDDGEPNVVRCLEYDLIYNAFIWLNTRHKETLHRALKVFQYMLHKELCVPTQRTWSILICGFLYHDEKEQAKQLFHLMTQHGFAITDICGEYLPYKATLGDLEARVADVLDFTTLSDGFDSVSQANERQSTTHFASHEHQRSFRSSKTFLNPYLDNFSNRALDPPENTDGQHFGRDVQPDAHLYSHHGLQRLEPKVERSTQ